MDLKTYWLAFKAGWPIILGTLVVAVGAAALLSQPGTPQYSSTTRLFIAAQTGSPDLSELYQRNAIAALRVKSYVELARSGAVVDELSEEVGSEVDPGTLAVSVVPETVVLSVSVLDSDAERARDVAAAVGEVLPKHIAEMEQLDNPSDPPVQARVIDEASEASLVSTSQLPRNLIAAALLGLGLGCGISVLRYAMKHSSSAPASRTDVA